MYHILDLSVEPTEDTECKQIDSAALGSGRMSRCAADAQSLTGCSLVTSRQQPSNSVKDASDCVRTIAVSVSRKLVLEALRCSLSHLQKAMLPFH